MKEDSMEEDSMEGDSTVYNNKYLIIAINQDKSISYNLKALINKLNYNLRYPIEAFRNQIKIQNVQVSQRN